MGLFDIFKSKPKPQPPYDALTQEQRYALYFLLDYYGYKATDRQWNYIKQDAYNYLEKGIIPETNKQIFKELDYCFKKYKLIPSEYISYERYSFAGKEDENFRITFDTNLLSRDHDLNLDKGDYGESLIDRDTYLMEVKCLGSFPIWFTKVLSEMKIYPVSFSKYGEVYKNKIVEKGSLKC